MARVLVTDGSERSSLAVVRSLGAAGHEVHLCSGEDRGSLAGASRHCVTEDVVPHPLGEPGSFTSALRELVEARDIDVLIPVTDAAILAIRSSPELGRSVMIPFPSLEQIRRLSDKTEVVRAAKRAGLAVPESRRIEAPEALQRTELDDLSPPFVIKPGRSVAEADGGSRSEHGVEYAADREQLVRRIAELPPGAFPLLIQERIDGWGLGVFLLLWDGDVIGRFAHRRIREKPPWGGVSVYRESAEPEPELFHKSAELLRAFGWRGVAMVEYRVEEATGVPHVMEINGRFWGSLQLAVDSGVDFPRLLLDLALGRSPEPVLEYRSGVRCRWWWGDVDHLLTCLRSPGRSADAPGARLPGRARALREFLTLWRPGDRSEVFRPRDPAPFLREAKSWMREVAVGNAGGEAL